MLSSHSIVIGSGIAGLSAAIQLSDAGQSVVLMTKGKIDEGSTRWAQGGIASVWSSQDSFESHIQDTLKAGDGLCKREVVDLVVREGPDAILKLISLGVPFSKNISDYDLHREAGHAQRRILHATDQTGEAIETALIRAVKERKSVRILEFHTAIDLIKSTRILGVYALDEKLNRVITLGAQSIFLATGGAGKVYLYTSNPDVSTGDGVAMASRAGAKIAGMEFYQFHPTCLYHSGDRTFLISEALRGEGAKLLNAKGQAFMSRYHPAAELAPRDIVARAIDSELKKTGDKCAYLDARHLGLTRLKQEFPSIYSRCAEAGIKMEKDLVPVVPAAHYMCGGVETNSFGESSIAGLYAIGETAHTGLHGANRLASNSLLESVVFANRAVAYALTRSHERIEAMEPLPPALPDWNPGNAVALEEQIDITATWLEIRTLMWNYAGIVRTDKRLRKARDRLAMLRREIQENYWAFHLTRELIELRNLVLVAELIVNAATERKSNVGLHYNIDNC